MIDEMYGDFTPPPGYVHPETVEDAANHLQKLTFPD